MFDDHNTPDTLTNLLKRKFIVPRHKTMHISTTSADPRLSSLLYAICVGSVCAPQAYCQGLHSPTQAADFKLL